MRTVATTGKVMPKYRGRIFGCDSYSRSWSFHNLSNNAHVQKRMPAATGMPSNGASVGDLANSMQLTQRGLWTKLRRRTIQFEFLNMSVIPSWKFSLLCIVMLMRNTSISLAKNGLKLKTSGTHVTCTQPVYWLPCMKDLTCVTTLIWRFQLHKQLTEVFCSTGRLSG